MRKATKKIVGQKKRGQPVGEGPNNRSSTKPTKTGLDENGLTKSRVYKDTERKAVSAETPEKMATKPSSSKRTWKQFEQLIAKIQQALA